MASEASSSGIVEGWLRSVDMVQYTQAFLDNGYDDLEVCKQIGEADLNAIGVPNDHQREKLLQAVRVLREEGGAAVYFTLEDCDNCPSGDPAEVGDGSEETPSIVSGPPVAGKCVEPPHCEGSTLRLDVHDLGQQGLVSYPKAQLGYILRDKLVLENIDLSEPPYTTPDLAVCGSSLTALAMRFAEELTTHFMDVLEGLEELWLIARNNDLCSDLCRSGSRGVYCGSQSFYYGYPYQYRPSHRLHHPGSPGSQPPPLPSCPPPVTVSGGYLDRCLSLQSHLDGLHYRPEQFPHQNYVYTDGESTASADDKKKGGSVFGRFLRNIGFRKSNRKGSYNKYQGDLSAYEISMSDEDRMALMVLVKEGKISTQTALAVVQKFEEGRRAAGKVGPSDTGKENVCDTPSKKGKKKKSIRPLKSQSTPSTDDRHRYPQVVSPAECEQICRQRRVHSLGQLDVSHIQPHHDQQYNHQPTRMSLTRAMSCSPASTHSPRLTSHMEPPAHSRIYGPGHQQLQQPPPPPPPSHYHHHHHGLNKVDALRERLTGRPVNTVPKTSSKTSLLSSGSDQSMECGMQTPLRVDPMTRQGVDRAAYNSNSTVSMNSESNSPISGRKKSGMQEALLKSHCSTSCSTGDDGISSENDDVDHNSKRSLQIDGGKERMPLDLNSQRLSRTKEAGVVKPPLLRQRSAPGATPLCSGPVLGQAKVILDYVPATHEKDFLHLKKGDMINIISMADSGVWVGVVGGRKGKFRFDHVEVAIEADRTICERKCVGHTDMPRTIDEFLRDMGLEHLTTLFLMNGYDDLDIFSELDDHDLDALHITDPDQRTKVLSAARLLVNWPEYKTSCPSSLLNMDSPSSRAGNSSCDSGCYAGGEAKQTRCRSHESRGSHCDEKKVDNVPGNSPSPSCHFPCHLCGKPKPPRKYSGVFSQFPLGHNLTQSHYSPSHVVHCTRQSPYAPGHFQYNSPQQYGVYNLGHYGYHYLPAHSQYSQGHSQYALSVSRTLSELSVADNRSVPGRVEALHVRKPGNNTSNSLYATDNSSVDTAGQPALSDKASIGDRVSLTEEDQEIIAITYGTSDSRKVPAPIQPYSGRSSQLDMLSSTLSCSACISSTGCAQCDESLLCDSMSCQQCAAYMSCSQCFPYRHYVNTTMRSDSKSSKMSCSSTCTQTTCLSPDRDDSSHSGGSNLIDYTTSSQGSYYMVRPNQGKPQQCCYYQQHYPPQPVYNHLVVPAGAPPPAQLPSPTLTELARVSPISLTHANSNSASGLTLTLKPDAPSTLAPPGDWSSHLSDNEAPGMATLYSRGRSQTPDKSEKGDGGQMKSPTRSLMPLVSTKLSAEMIDLAQLPYSTTIGHCGIPPLLVQRYSEELRQDVETMSVVLEQLREKQLRNLGRPCIQNEILSESCKSACDLQISSIHNFLVSIGLPMYQRPLAEGGVSTLEQLLKLKDAEIEQMTGADSRHLRRIAHALEWVQLKLASSGPGGRICS